MKEISFDADESDDDDDDEDVSKKISFTGL
mgnify:CR=1 FL=1